MVLKESTHIQSNEYTHKLIIAFVCSFCFSITFSLLFSIDAIKSISFIQLFYRNLILFPCFLFISFHFVFPIKKMYIWIYDHKWLLGFLFLAFVTIFRIHGDSISVYSVCVQPNHVNVYSMPILGEHRLIRTDEYIVTTPSILASSLGSHPFAKYSHILRGTKTLTIINGVYLGLATLSYAPWELIYAILPVENAYSFCWYAPLVLSLLMSTELFHIISKNKLTASVGGILVVCSSFYVWWGFNSYFFTGPGTIYGVYRFIQSDSKLKKFLYALLVGWLFSAFIVNLYPAWQVPLGYIYLAIGIWLLYSNWDKIKEFSKNDYLFIGFAILLCLFLVLVYFRTISDYTTAITNTVYPGHRVDNGHYRLNKIFLYGQSIFYPFKDIGNSSEASVFFSLFPIPTIMGLYCFIKEKKKDVLLGGLLIVQAIMLIYVTVGMPSILAKVLLFSNSTAKRTVDMLGYSEIIMIVCLFTNNRERIKLPFILGFLLSLFTALICVRVSSMEYTNYLTVFERYLVFILIFVLSLGFTVKIRLELEYVLKCALVIITLIASVTVRPVMVGLDAIYSKPIAKEILKITHKDENSKWITMGGYHIMGVAVSCGAPTINFVNTYPNIKLWHKLDPSHKYEEVYNRYAHIGVQLTDGNTSFKLDHDDALTLNLSYKDIHKTKVKYLAMIDGQHIDFNNGYVTFNEIYSEDGAKIYELSYN